MANISLYTIYGLIFSEPFAERRIVNFNFRLIFQQTVLSIWTQFYSTIITLLLKKSILFKLVYMLTYGWNYAEHLCWYYWCQLNIWWHLFGQTSYVLHKCLIDSKWSLLILRSHGQKSGTVKLLWILSAVHFFFWNSLTDKSQTWALKTLMKP